MQSVPNTAQTFCPVCQQYDKGFKQLDRSFRVQAEKYGFRLFGQGEMTPHETYSCSLCGASDRERLYAVWINEQIIAQKLHSYSRTLHFSPENGLSQYLQHLGIFKYYETSDPIMPSTDHRYDLMSIDRPANSVDFFICSHVLEHVPDDQQALSELYRISAKNGFGILMAPIIVGLEKTYENPAITSEEERWQHFGQGDHLRLYAHADYVKLLEQSGFIVRQLTWRHFGSQVIKRLGLKPTSRLYIVEK